MSRVSFGTRLEIRSIIIGILVLAQSHVCAEASTNSIAAESPPAPAVTGEEPAVLSIFNRPVAILRSDSFGMDPDERVRISTERINALIQRRIYGPIATQDRTEGTSISVGGEIVMLIKPGDVDPLAEITFEQTVAETVHLLTIALDEARVQRSTSYLIRAGLKVLLATILFLGVLVALIWANRFVRRRTIAVEEKMAKQLNRRGLPVLAQLTALLHWSLRVFFWVVIGISTFEWLAYSLRRFYYTRRWGDELHGTLGDFLVGIGSAILQSLPDLLIIGVIILVTKGVVSLIRTLFRSIETGRVAAGMIETDAARATQRIVVVFIWLLAIVMIYPYIPGSGSAAFKGMSVFVGLLVSLGSSSVVGQFTSGLVLMYSRALKQGEYVRIGEYEGAVETLGFLSTKIRSPKNEELHVPNLVILGTTIKNYSRLAGSGGLWLHTSVTIGYDAPWRQVHAMLIEAARRTQGLIDEPPPFVMQVALSDFYVDYQINALIVEPNRRLRVLADLHANIQDVFNEYGVQIMSPHFMADKSQPVFVPKDKWAPPPAESSQRGETTKQDQNL